MSPRAAARFLWPVLGHDPVARLRAAIDHANAHYADTAFCVITGDVVERASAASYRAVKAELDRLSMPYWPMTGNHDARSLLRAMLPLPANAMTDFIQYELEVGPVRILCLDSLFEGEDKGRLCPARLAWLEERLAQHPDRPTIVMLHHPPMPLGLPMLDPDRLEDGPALLAVLRRFPAVKQLCFGHVHRPVSGQIDGLAYCGLRAVLYQAPPPVPAWDWDSFAPAKEAPQMGVVTCTKDQIGIEMIEFCPADCGLVSGDTG